LYRRGSGLGNKGSVLTVETTNKNTENKSSFTVNNNNNFNKMSFPSNLKSSVKNDFDESGFEFEEKPKQRPTANTITTGPPKSTTPKNVVKSQPQNTNLIDFGLGGNEDFSKNQKIINNMDFNMDALKDENQKGSNIQDINFAFDQLNPPNNFDNTNNPYPNLNSESSDNPLPIPTQGTQGIQGNQGNIGNIGFPSNQTNQVNNNFEFEDKYNSFGVNNLPSQMQQPGFNQPLVENNSNVNNDNNYSNQFNNNPSNYQNMDTLGSNSNNQVNQGEFFSPPQEVMSQQTSQPDNQAFDSTFKRKVMDTKLVNLDNLVSDKEARKFDSTGNKGMGMAPDFGNQPTQNNKEFDFGKVFNNNIDFNAKNNSNNYGNYMNSVNTGMNYNNNNNYPNMMSNSSNMNMNMGGNYGSYGNNPNSNYGGGYNPNMGNMNPQMNNMGNMNNNMGNINNNMGSMGSNMYGGQSSNIGKSTPFDY